MDDAVLAFLNGRQGANDAGRVTTYSVYLNATEVTVNVLDFGADAGSGRYSVEAYPTDLPPEERDGGSPLYTLSNPEPTIELALAAAHWENFRSAS